MARDAAAAMYADLRAQVVRMLGCDLIHGDLSPYNVLLGRDGPVVIDFPQVVGAAHNSQAESFLHRDVENLRRFFAALDPALRSAANDAREIWRAYTRRELTPDFVPSGKPPPEPPHAGHAHHAPAHAPKAAHAGDPRRSHPPRHPSPAPRPPGGPGRDRRRGAPGPDVIRVARPPLGAQRPPAPEPHRAPPPPPPPPHAGSTPRAEDGRPRRRRRRRRR